MRDPRTKCLHFFHVVAGVDNGHPRGIQASDHVENVVARLWIDARSRLIEQKESRTVDDGDGEIQAPLHTPGEGTRSLIRAISQANCGE